MLARRWMRRDLVAALAACASILALTATAEANPDLVLTGQSITLSGKVKHRFVRLMNGSRITVAPYDGQPGTSTGRLEIIAHDIIVDGTSEIDATGAGYRGIADANGEGSSGGQGAASSSDATGGGGHAGKGGDGLMSGCNAIAGAVGGAAFIASANDVTFGSAGSAAGVADGDSGGRGGDGGGAIILRAGKIELSGEVRANGKPGAVVNDDAAGGGAGGGVLVESSYLVAYGGLISAIGASGGAAPDDEGGGGGGGHVLLVVPAIPGGLQIDIRGGTATCPAAAGNVGQAVLGPQTGCLDLDGDGFQSDTCGGADCDDSDAKVHPGASETCNGEDDDCSGATDDHGAANSCNSGVCVAGACKGDDAGTDGPSDDGPAEDGSPQDGPTADGSGADAGDDGSPQDGAAVDSAVGDETGPGAVLESGDTGTLVLRGGCQTGRGRGGAAGVLLLVGAALMFGRMRRPAGGKT